MLFIAIACIHFYLADIIYYITKIDSKVDSLKGICKASIILSLSREFDLLEINRFWDRGVDQA